METLGTPRKPRSRRPLDWWPVVLFLATATAIIWVRTRTDSSFQERNLTTLSILLGATLLWLLCWLAFSRRPWRIRLLVLLGCVLLGGIGVGMFRIRGVSGDLFPIIEFRWASAASRSSQTALAPATQPNLSTKLSSTTKYDFPQFLGPDRNGVLSGPGLETDWVTHPPQVLWRRPVGPAWSGWAVAGTRALTQEQIGETEAVSCCELLTGRPLWVHADPAHFQNALAGEGPRCTPTVSSNRVFTLGATGLLNCLNLETGQKIWARDIVKDAGSHVPEWGFAGSPLICDDLVVVSAGGSPDRSLLAYRAGSGELAWGAGDQSVGYSSPALATLSGVRQILIFNSRKICAHDPSSGRILWEYAWGTGHPHVAMPVIISTNRVLFSSGYGFGSEVLEISAAADGRLEAKRVWHSQKMKAKFANPVRKDGFLYGLDDGILACLDLSDGSSRWKADRYGHGQGLLVRDLLLLMAENGELVLLNPSPEAPNERQRFRVFHGKTWNPIALAGDLLLARTDQEAVCLRLPTAQPDKH
jgi:outer membrane protein assembly factor BamB